MSTLNLVSDCSALRYCTDKDQALEYGNQYVVQWNNAFPPLTPNVYVTISVYSDYDLTKPIYTKTGVPNTNGRYGLTPDPTWFSRYDGTDSDTGRDQQIYVAVYLQGNDPPAVGSMLPMKLTATPEQYADILNILHPPSTTATTASPSAVSESALRASPATSASAEDSDSDLLSETMTMDFKPSSSPPSASSLESSESDAGGDAHGRSGLSGGAIAGIVVGSVIGLLLLLLLLLLPIYRRRQRRTRMLARSLDAHPPPPMSSASSTNSHPGGGSDAAVAAAAAAGAVAGGAAANEKLRPDSMSPSDTPLLLGGRPNNSFNSREGSLVDSQLSPKTAVYHPLSLESPRVMMNMPASTRSASALPAKPASPDPILSSDDARQIGDIFRDALRKPPPVSEDGTSESPGHRDSILMHMDDELEGEEDPGWRERVASERMQRELEQEASVIRTVAMRAHGSDYSSSRPGTSQSRSSLQN
ncbi:hypothetical protein IWW50_000584 [Coemansia erecta]|nr:hypothetical protein IWW50_000584 [Coemansia erecta]